MRHKARISLAVTMLAVIALASCTRSGTAGKETGDEGGRNGGGGTPTAEFGTTKVACGKNETGETLGASDQGVTADSIHLATISDVGFTARPGLNQELFDASDVFAKWCNDLGGINGRKIVVDKRDAALTNYKPMITQSCTTDFALVGGGGVFDDAGQDERLECLLPNFPGYVVSAEARGADLTVQPLPNPTNEQNAGGVRWVKEKFPDSTGKVAFIVGNIGSLKLVGDQFKEEVRRNGMSIIDDKTYNPLGEASWTPFAQSLKSQGVKGLFFVGEPEFLAKLEQAMAALDYAPDWVLVPANQYDRQLLQLGGGSLKNLYVIVFTVPFDSDNPAMKKYLDLFDHYLPKGKSKAVLGVNSFASWLLFAEAASKCGAKLTRKCAYENATKISDFTAGGIQAPTDPGSGQPSKCFALMTVKDNEFELVDMGSDRGIFDCRDDNVMKLDGNYGKGTTLADVGKSMADLP